MELPLTVVMGRRSESKTNRLIPSVKQSFQSRLLSLWGIILIHRQHVSLLIWLDQILLYIQISASVWCSHSAWGQYWFLYEGSHLSKLSQITSPWSCRVSLFSWNVFDFPAVVDKHPVKVPPPLLKVRDHRHTLIYRTFPLHNIAV